MEYREKPPRSIPVTEKTTLLPFLQANLPGKSRRSEERRVGKECRL